MVLDGLLYLPLLDSNVSLRNCGAAMLQEMLDKGNVIAAVPVNLSGIEFSERVCPYVLDAKVVADDMKLFLYCPFRQREDYFCWGDMVFKAIELDELIQRHGNSKASCFARFLLADGKAISVPVFHYVVQMEPQNVGDTQPQISFQHESGSYTVIGSAASEALTHGRDDFLVLLKGQCYGSFVHRDTSNSDKKFVLLSGRVRIWE